ncbi:hypothetical protein WN48_00440 [Eufriesea mexicana]|nr:hypothetical protein WN48_00440 [Eufriesea mexicana]
MTGEVTSRGRAQREGGREEEGGRDEEDRIEEAARGPWNWFRSTDHWKQSSLLNSPPTHPTDIKAYNVLGDLDWLRRRLDSEDLIDRSTGDTPNSALPCLSPGFSKPFENSPRMSLATGYQGPRTPRGPRGPLAVAHSMEPIARASPVYLRYRGVSTKLRSRKACRRATRRRRDAEIRRRRAVNREIGRIVELDQALHFPHLVWKHGYSVAADIQLYESQVRQVAALPTYRQVHDHVAPQVQGPKSREIAHPRRQIGDFVAAGVQLCQCRHPAQFVRQGCQSVVSDQQRLQRNNRILKIVLARTCFPDFWKVLKLSTAKLEFAAQVCFLQDSLETSSELLLYVAAHVRRDHRHITFFGHVYAEARQRVFFLAYQPLVF